jgi:hypothetical protein
MHMQKTEESLGGEPSENASRASNEGKPNWQSEESVRGQILCIRLGTRENGRYVFVQQHCHYEDTMLDVRINFRQFISTNAAERRKELVFGRCSM